MNILIIEDEIQAARSLGDSIRRLKPEAEIVGVVDTVEEMLRWFAANQQPDMIFSDIQLGDGTAFDAFQQINISCPVIFCTAFDEYFLKAFQSNGIDYLLKPVDDAHLKKSFDKIDLFRHSLTTAFPQRPFKSNFLFPHRDKLIPVSTEQIAFFKVTETLSAVGLMDGRNYHHNYTLDYLSTVLDTSKFYRANRQYILNISAIQDIEHFDERKLLVHLRQSCGEKIIVSKAKASQFLQWVEVR